MAATKRAPEYSVPEIPQPAPISVAKDELDYDKQLLALTKGGVMKVRVEEDVVVSRIAHDIYANPRSGYREMYANAVTACLVAKEEFGAKPAIKVTINPLQRTLEIEETDSIGISVETLSTIYLILGRSGNMGGDKLGQYGFGKVAYTTLTDRVYIATKWRTKDGKDGEYAVEGRDGREYVILPKPMLNSYGTTVKMVLNQKVALEPLVRYVFATGRFSRVPTTLVLTHDVPREYGRRFQAGTFELSNTYSQSLRTKLENRTVLKEYKFKGVGFEFAALALLDGDRYSDTSDDEGQRRAYVLGMPVDQNLVNIRDMNPVTPFSRWILNITDERMYPPTADRERLKESTEEALAEALRPLVAKALSEINFSSLAKYLQADEKLRFVFTNAQVVDFLSTEARAFRQLLNQDYAIQGTKEQKSLVELMKDTPLDLIVFEEGRFDRERTERIRKHNDKAVIIRGNSSSELLKANGFLSAREYITKHGLDAIPVDSFAVYGSKIASIGWGGCARPAKDVQYVTSIDKMVVKLTKGKRQYLPLLSKVKADYKLCSDRPDLRGKGIALEDFLEQVGQKKIETNKGILKVKEVPKSARGSVYLAEYSDPALASYLKHVKQLLIFSDRNTIFEIAVFLTANSVTFGIDLEGHRFYQDHVPKQPKNLPWSWDFKEGGWSIGDSEVSLSALHVIYAVRSPVLKAALANSFRKIGAEEATKVRKGILGAARALNRRNGC